MRAFALFLAGVAALGAQTPSLEFLNHGRPVLDAHNCYPYEGQWTDRLDRALRLGFPVAIEQDLTWHIDRATGEGRVVVSHTDKTAGNEPTLRDHFFEHVRPIVEAALRENNRSRWPLIVLHFDFKSEEPPLLRAVWDLLGTYQDWITTAVKTSDSSQLSPLDARPILVLTEDSDRQEKVFYQDVPAGSKLRIFGSAHTEGLRDRSGDERAHFAATASPATLLSAPATNYRRWWNNSWALVEEGGQRKAGEWTGARNARVRELAAHAHRLGYWIRFYTLDGFLPGENRGWDEGYNFGSRAAVEQRWKAALDAGVDLIATDQYEELGQLFAKRPKDTAAER
ncbi:MAG: hypothetical protein C5B51_11610 [Terriglobia bacterium]|nr:MAG: hypothetical protein C5B51_11610 [Terriglobia bacterium]